MSLWTSSAGREGAAERDEAKAHEREQRNLLRAEAQAKHADYFEPETAEVVAFDGEARTVTLRFDFMPRAAVGERWVVRQFVP